MKKKKKKKVLGSKRKRILFKKDKRKIIELKTSKKIKEILPEKIESGLEKEIEDVGIFKNILKATESKRKRVAESRTNLEQEISSAPMPKKEEDEKINYSPNQENSAYLSETQGRERTDNIEYPSGNLSEISTGTSSPRSLYDSRKIVNETKLTRQEFLDPMRGNLANTKIGREKTFEVHDKKYTDAKEEKYSDFKQ